MIIVYPIKVTKGLFKNYFYLVINQTTREAVLVDPAWEIVTIEQFINNYDIKLTAVLLTHHHFDHVELAQTLAYKYHLPVRMSRIEIEYYNFSCHNLEPIEQMTQFREANMTIWPLFTPGHTKGSISYWIEDEIFTGDTLFIEGCGMCVDKGSCAKELFASLSYLKTHLPSYTRIYPGHSYGEEPGKTLAYLLDNNIYLQFNEQEQFVAFRMRKNQKRLMNFK